MKNLVLIGFMGSGKSTTGRVLASRLGRTFVDTDELIEAVEKRSVSEIFATSGEAEFRKMERRVASLLGENSPKVEFERFFGEVLRSRENLVVATGGGFYKTGLVKQMGEVVFLKVRFESVLARFSRDSREVAKRPLFADLARARAVFEERAAEYAALADVVVEADEKSVEEVVSDIVGKFRF